MPNTKRKRKSTEHVEKKVVRNYYEKLGESERTKGILKVFQGKLAFK